MLGHNINMKRFIDPAIAISFLCSSIWMLEEVQIQVSSPLPPLMILGTDSRVLHMLGAQLHPWPLVF